MSEQTRADLARSVMTVLPRFGGWAVNIRDFMTPYGRLGFRQLAILWALRHDLVPPDELSPTTLARQQNVRPSVITRALTRLEEGGLVVREMDLQDRRRIILTLTDKGRDASIYVERMYLREIMNSMSDFDDDTIDEIVRAVANLETVIGRLELTGHVGESAMVEDDE